MSKSFFKLSNGSFTQNWNDTSLITVTNDWSNVPSIVGYRGDGLASSGKDARLVVADSTVVSVMANQGNPNTNSTGGVAEFHLADPVVALQGSGTAQAPNLVLYLDATGVQSLHLALDLRDIDGSTDNAFQQIAVQYRVGDTGNWTTIPSAYVADASSGPSLATLVTHLEVDLPSALDNQGQVELRILTTDAAGSDEWIGVDNIVVSSQAAGRDVIAPTVLTSNPADGGAGVAGGANLVLNFSEAVTLGSGHVVISDGAGDVRTIDVRDASQVTLSGQTLTINPALDLHLGSSYHLTLDAGAVVDLAGNAFLGNAANPVDFATALPLTAIYTIQGAAHTSPLLGQTAHTQGVVTAIDTSGAKGFWIQDMTGDGNPATSDGVFVASTTAGAQVKIGDLVDLQGTVEENAGSGANNLTITQLNGVQNLSVVSGGHVIAPTVIGHGGLAVPTEVVAGDHFATFDPVHNAIDFYESVEGMLLTAQDVQVVSNSVAGATWVVTDQGAYATGANDRGGLTASPGDVNPERFELYNDTGVNTGNTASWTTGDKLGNVTGVMSYFGGDYELIPTQTPAAAVHAPAARETTAIAADASHLTVGSYDLGALSPNDSQAKYDALAQDIVAHMKAPDLLGLQGVQDNNGNGGGELAADLTLGRLIDAIAAAGGPQYGFVAVDPADENVSGGAFNTNPRSAVLYNTTRVQYVEESAHLLGDSSPADGDGFAGNVHPLTADFTFRGETVSYIGVDNASRAGGEELFGHDQPAAVVGDALRADQIATVGDFVSELQHDAPGANIVVAGNFNALHYDPAMTSLEANTGLANLVWQLAPTDRYTSANEGNNEQLDHVLVSGGLAGGAQFDDVHLNTNQAANSMPAERDPVVASVYLNHAPLLQSDTYGATEDTALGVDAIGGVLSNDSDLNQDAMVATLVGGPAHGSLAFHPDGSFAYTPAPDYNGDDSFSYIATDALGASSAPTTVLLKVLAVNDAPTIAASAPSTFLVEDGMGGPGIASALVHLSLADVDSAVDYANDGWIGQGGGLFSMDGNYGTAVLDTVNHTLSYTLDNTLPATDGLAEGANASDNFTVTVTDGASTASVPVSFAIIGANDTPYGKADHASVNEDATLAIDVLRNDGDADGDHLSLALTDSHSALGASISVQNGQVQYTADADAFDLLATGQSLVDSFSYTLNDGHGGLTAPIAVTVVVHEAGDNRSLTGGNGNDVFVDTPGHDTTYFGGNGNDVLSGGDGADWLDGGNGDDVLDGGSGTNHLDGGNGNDTMIGGVGDDTMIGGNGDDSFSASDGNNNLDGGNGNDVMVTGKGNDVQSGGNGNDIFVSGAGNDKLSGGNGNDVFVFGSGTGQAVITDFRPNEDTIATSYTGTGAQANLVNWANSVRGSNVSGAPVYSFTDIDTDGNGAMDAVAISGGHLGGETIVLSDWSVAQLVGQHYLTAAHQVTGGWLV